MSWIKGIELKIDTSVKFLGIKHMEKVKLKSTDNDPF